MPGGREIDPVTFEIVRHRLFRVVDEAIVALENVSGSPITNEGHDLMVSLYRADGGLLIGGVGFLHHLTSAAQAVRHLVQHYSDDPGFFEGDTYFFNDAYSGALHTPDVYMISPIHFEGKLRGFVANFVHVTDIGAIDAGGFSPRAEESFQEGFASKGIKLLEREKIRKDVMETILNMVRDPGMVALDFKSQIAANNVGRMRMQDLMKEYGADLVDLVGEKLIEQSEMLVRRRLRELPNGTWRARQYIDHTNKIYTIVLAMTKEDDTLIYDFTGTSAQANVGINSSFWGTWGGIFAPIFPLLAYDITWNEGITRPVRLIAPEGTVVNPVRPAPVSIATISAIQIVNNLSTTCLSKMFGASRKYKEQATAVWHGSHAHVTTHGINPEGHYYVSPLTDTFAGAGGARAFKDGVDLGGEIPNVVSRWGNVETHEEDLPLIYLYRRVVRDSGGPGKYRGGVCHEYAITPHDSPAHALGTVLFGKGVRAPQSTGIFGGYPGCNVAYTIFRNSVSWEEALAKGLPFSLESTQAQAIEQVQWGLYDLKEGNILYIRFMGGGGYGDPLDRDPELVRQDVKENLVSIESARDIYGVIIGAETGNLNWTETTRQRDDIRKERLNGKVVKAKQVPGVPPTDLRISEYLQVVESGGESSVQCTWCGEMICPLDIHWKKRVPMKEYPITKAGPFRSQNDLFFLREFYCPECAVLLDTEVFLKGDPPLYDEIYF